MSSERGTAAALVSSGTSCPLGRRLTIVARVATGPRAFEPGGKTASFDFGSPFPRNAIRAKNGTSPPIVSPTTPAAPSAGSARIARRRPAPTKAELGNKSPSR